MSTGKFPLEPLCALRSLRLRVLETELRRCRAQLEQAEQQRLEAVAAHELARDSRQIFVESSWLQLFGQGGPNGTAMDRHERHLALLDHGIVERQATVESCHLTSTEARDTFDQALSVWRKANNKLDAIGEMKQAWQRDLRHLQERREEQNLEELALRQTTPG